MATAPKSTTSKKNHSERGHGEPAEKLEKVAVEA